MKADDLQQQLLQFIATIPADTNPYAALRGWIRDQISPNIPYSGIVQLYILAGLLGFTLVLVVLSLVIRAQKRIFWVFQLSRSPTLIRPHFSISWSLVAVLFLVVFELYIVEAINLFKRDLRPDFGYWACLVWLLPFVGGAWAAWSLGVSFLQHVQASGSDAPIAKWAMFSNVAGVVTPLFYLAIMLPVGSITGRYFYTAVSTYLKVDKILETAANEWRAPERLNIAKLATALPYLKTLESSQSNLVKGWRATYGLYTFMTFFLVSSLLVIGSLHLFSLRGRIKQTERDLQGVDTSRSATEQIRRTYQTLQWTIAAFCILGMSFVTIAGYATANPSSLQHAMTAQILVLTPLYSFALLGLPTALSLVWRAIEAQPSDSVKFDSFSGSGGHHRSNERASDVKKFSIELNGRGSNKGRTSRSGRFGGDLGSSRTGGRGGHAGGGQVSVTVDVLIREEGSELEKWESLSEHKI